MSSCPELAGRRVVITRQLPLFGKGRVCGLWGRPHATRNSERRSPLPELDGWRSPEGELRERCGFGPGGDRRDFGRSSNEFSIPFRPLRAY